VFEAQQFWSQHAETNALLDVPGLDVYMTPSCLMHSVDHGVFVKVLDLIIQLVKAAGQTTSSVFEDRQVRGFFLKLLYEFIWNAL